jgi:hypothetical protein
MNLSIFLYSINNSLNFTITGTTSDKGIHLVSSQTDDLSLIVVFWVVTPCSIVGDPQHFGEALLTTHKPTWCQNPEKLSRELHCYENLISDNNLLPGNFM